ncbi:MAG TPA: hypothetical protein VFD03_03730, partial [Clostridia bacterium]|nr:hypothetical protein [Clostridia bacterium]
MKFIHKITSSKSIIWATVIMMLLFIAAGAYFTNNELKTNQTHYLESLDIQQGYFVNQLSEQLKYMSQEGADSAQLSAYLSQNVEASGSRWVFLCVGNKVEFAKNISTTESLGDKKYWDEFLSYLESQEDMRVKYTSFEDGIKTYKVGLVYSESAALNEAFIPKHNISIMMTSGLAALVLLCLTLASIVSSNRVKKRWESVEDTLVQRNHQIEQLIEDVEQYEANNADQEPDFLRGQVYQDDLMRGFLQKSDDPALSPICMIGIYIIMGNDYFTKDRILGYIEPIRALLSPRHILGEIKKGEFLAILYRTDLDEASLLRDKIRAVWDQGVSAHGVGIGVGIIEVNSKKDTA